MPSTRIIPGYHYDETTGKYYKTLPNHLAPSGSQHSRQAVAVKQAEDTSQTQQASTDAKKRRHLVRKTAFSRHVRLSLLGRLAQGPGATRSDILESILRQLIPEDHYLQKCRTFTIDPCTNLLLLSGETVYTIEARRLRSSPQSDKIFSTEIDYMRTHSSVQNITLAGPTHLIYTTSHWQDVHVSTLPYPRKPTTKIFQGDPMSQEFRMRDEEFSVHALAGTPVRKTFAAATTLGLYVGQIHENSDVTFQPIITMRRGETSHEQMTVAFKEDETTIMCAQRSGKIWFYDTLTRAHTLRLHHSDAVSHLRSFSSGNLLLVNGLRSLCVYDLRITPAPLSPSSPKKMKLTAPKRGPKHRSKNHEEHLTQNTPEDLTPPYSRPYLNIPIPKALESDRYGPSFAFHSHLGLIARASSNTLHGHWLTLYSLRTGRPIDCELSRKKWDDVVTCVEISTAVRDGALSVIVGCANGRVEEWTVA